MTSFTLTQLGNKSGEVAEAAFKGPVDITKHGKRKFVLMTAEQFDSLRRGGGQRAYRVEDLNDEERRELLEGLDAVAQESDRIDG